MSLSPSLAMEAKLARVADDLVSVIQALRLMSDMQRQQGEQLAQVIALLTPESVAPQTDLSGLLAQLVAVVGSMGADVRQVGAEMAQATRLLPGQLEIAVDRALVRAEQRDAGR